MKEIQKFTLDNGVRLLVEPVDFVQSVAIGLTCKTGSQDELEREAGITHVIEHMLFKGTPTRSAKQIAEDIEGKGGILNAFTDKEQTSYYCRVLSQDFSVGIDVLSDIVLNPLLDQEELNREKGVILEEIKRSEDDPAEHVHELHLAERWGSHPLGKPIIGTKESVSSFGAGDLKAYMQRQYRAENMVLAVAGNVDPKQIKEATEKSFLNFRPGAQDLHIEKPRGIRSYKEISDDIEQVHFCIGTDSCSILDLEERYTMSILDGILGGGMSSRLFQEIREKRGLVYAIGSYNINYTAGGIFTVYGGTSLEAWPQVQELTQKEFDRLRKGEIDEDELQKVKNNQKGHLVLGLEGMSARMLRMTRQELFHRRIIPVEEALERLQAVTKEQVIEMAQKILTEELVNITAIGPF